MEKRKADGDGLLDAIALQTDSKTMVKDGILIVQPRVYPDTPAEAEYFKAMHGLVDFLEGLPPALRRALAKEEWLDFTVLTKRQMGEVRALLLDDWPGEERWRQRLDKGIGVVGFLFDPYLEIERSNEKTAERHFIRGRLVVPAYDRLAPGDVPGTWRRDLQPRRMPQVKAVTAREGITESVGAWEASIAGLTFTSLLGGAAIQGAEPPQPAKLVLGESRSYALKELTELIRGKTQIEVYADRRLEDRRVFVSRGAYDASALVEAIRRATGTSVRKVGGVRFFARRDLRFGNMLYFPVLPRTVLEKIAKQLRPLGETAELRKEGIPWDAADFLAGKRIAFKDLGKEQQKFVRQAIHFLSSQGNDSGDGSRPPARGDRLDDAHVRLGISYLMVIGIL